MFNTFRFISNHPLTRDNKIKALSRWLRWQVSSRILGWSVAVQFVNHTRLLVSPGMTGATGNIYCGLHEYEDMGFVLHILRPGDLFVDVGANIGSYTILASATGARVLSFEPIPTTFESLLDNIHLNRFEGTVEPLNQAVGREAGVIEMTADQDTTNQILLSRSYEGKTAHVPVVTLDDAMRGRVPRLIKIDVEGFETEVLAGARETLENPGLQAIIMELNGSGTYHGFDEDELHQYLQNIGFQPHRYEPSTRTLTDLKGANSGSGNTMYLRNLEAIQTDLKNSVAYQVQGKDL